MKWLLPQEIFYKIIFDPKIFSFISEITNALRFNKYLTFSGSIWMSESELVCVFSNLLLDKPKRGLKQTETKFKIEENCCKLSQKYLLI